MRNAIHRALAPISRSPDVDVDVVMRMGWRLLTYVHWRVDPDQVARLLPEGLGPDVFDGSAWVGLIPFDMRGIRPPGVPDVLPYVGSFPETNVRTYVVGPDGRRGVYFHSLEASRLGAVAVAQLGYALPYQWARMRIEPRQGGLRYRSRRRWPGPRGARSDLEVAVGRPLAPAEVTPLDDFLSARWGLYVPLGERLARADVAHPPWPLHEARVVRLDDDLVAAAGYPGLADRAPDHVRFSPGVEVEVGLPYTVA